MCKQLPTGRRSSRTRSGVIGAVAATTIVVSLAGCSSSGASKSSSGASTQTIASTGNKANVAEAQSFVAKYSAPLTSVNLPPLKSAPPRGKNIALVVNNLPESNDLLNGMEEGAKALGWTTLPIVFDPSSATGLVDAYAKAADANPDGVVTQAASTAAYSQAAKRFAAKKIPVVTSNTDDAVTPPIISNVTNPDQVKLSGRIAANYIIAQKGENANVAMFNIPSFPILVAFETGFKSEYLRLCPGCKYKSVPVQPGDIGTKVPAQVVSTIQADSKINFAVMGFGAVATGVAGALRTAGISGVQIVGEAPALGNMTALTTGSEDMWVAFPLHGIGWKSIDALARYFNKESTAIDDSSATPFQILTKANVAKPAALPEVAGYQALFKQLWHVS